MRQSPQSILIPAVASHDTVVMDVYVIPCSREQIVNAAVEGCSLYGEHYALN